MMAIIDRPQKCPHYVPCNCRREGLCGYPTLDAPLYCDTSWSAVGRDGFPLICPLREEQDETKSSHEQLSFQRCCD